MPGAGRSSRGGGKRTASASASASACVYYATTGVFVALCVAGGYFYTKTSTASAEVQATVTAFRHTTRSSFAHEVPKAVATLQQREVTVDEPQGGIVEHASHLGSAKEEMSNNAAAGVGKPEGEGAEHVAGEANAEKDVKKDVAASEDAGVKAQEAEEKPQEAAQAEVQQPQEQEQQPKPQQEEDGGGDVGVKEKVLDGGVEEETRELQLPHEDEPAARDEQANGTGDSGSMRREAQEDPQGDGEETTEQQPAREEPQGEGMETTEQQPATEETHGDREERAEQKPEEEDSDDVGSRKEGEQNASVSEAGDTDQSLEESRGDGKPTVTEQEKEAIDGGHAGLNDHPHVLDSLTDESHTEASGDVTGEQKAWATQAYQSEKEKDRREEERANSNSNNDEDNNATGGGGEAAAEGEYEWRLCNVRTGADYIPCLDNEKAIKQLKTENYRRYEHRERHCPEESPTCLVALPAGYRRPIEWPKSRDRIWYSNVPHTKLVDVKGHQNWVKVAGRYLTFPGGGTQFIHGALHYIDFLQQSVRGIAWGKHTRVVLDVGCGVASFGGYLFDRDVVTISFAPKDEHEAQVQMALERGIPAISAVMGSKRLQFPSKVFDLVHCARCRVPWHADGGALLLELNRVLRPGGFFVWSATPVYQKLEEDVEIWRAMSALTKSMCWELVTIKKDRLNGIGAAFYRKPTSNECYETRRRQNPPMCSDEDDPNAAWYIRLNACMHSVPTDKSERGASWPEVWPRRLRTPPYWLNSSQAGVYGKAAPEDFTADYEHWRRVIGKSYLTGFGIDWSRVRNVMDMRAAYGGFAASLRDQKVWVMNVVNVDAPDTLPIIFERGLFGIYHDWCESFSTYPRTYDLLHADHLFSRIKDRCPILPVVVEVDRIVRPGGKVIVRDESDAVGEVEKVLRSLHWDVRLTFSKDNEGIVFAEKSDWRPELLAEPS